MRGTVLALTVVGTSTGEHGIGLGKMKYLEAEHGGAIAPMGRLKRAFDPQNVVNPGKILPPAALQ